MDWCGSGLSYFKPLPFISRLSEIWNGFHRKTSRPAYYIFLVLILQGTIATLPIITSQTDMGWTHNQPPTKHVQETVLVPTIT